MSITAWPPPELRLHDLPELTEQAALVTGRIPQVSRELARISIKRLLPGGPLPRELLTLGDLVFRWSFYFARQDEQVIFFFWRRASPVRVVLDAKMELRLAPDAGVAPDPATAPGRIRYRIDLPRFTVRDVTRELLDSLDLAGAEPEHVVVFELGRGARLAIDRPGDGLGGATMVWAAGSGVERLAPKNGRYRLRPFLSLIREIESWLGDGLGHPATIVPPPEEQRSDPWRLLDHLVSTWAGAVRALARAQPRREEPTLLDRLTTTYGVGGFSAAVLLRLTPDGRIAAQDADDPFTLRLTLRIDREATGATAEIALRPPDFLIDGALRDAFLDALADEIKDFAEELGAGRDEARTLLRTAWPSAVVFRVKREREHDTDVMVLNGILKGQRTLVVLTARFAVFAAEDPPRVELAGDLEVLFAGDPDDQDLHALPERVVRHFLRLAAEIRNWLRALA